MDPVRGHAECEILLERVLWLERSDVHVLGTRIPKFFPFLEVEEGILSASIRVEEGARVDCLVMPRALTRVEGNLLGERLGVPLYTHAELIRNTGSTSAALSCAGERLHLTDCGLDRGEAETTSLVCG